MKNYKSQENVTGWGNKEERGGVVYPLLHFENHQMLQ